MTQGTYQASSRLLFFVETGKSAGFKEAAEAGERVTDMLTADKLVVALTGRRRAAALGAESDDVDVARARSRERILLVHRTLARRRQRAALTRRLP